MITRNISPDELRKLRRARWMGRTNLLWLCNHVLGFRDVNQEVHGPIIELVQTFPLPPIHLLDEHDKVQPGFIEYNPWINPYDLPGKRRMLLLDPRGGLKTTINCAAHVIQWILNFPHLAYLIVQANSKKAEDIMREVKQHFQYNSVFRDIYPDYVPQKRVSDWGNREEFDVPDEIGRARILERYAKLPINCGRTRKEHTCMTASIDKGTAGYHWDVMKFSDIVEENNTRTPEQIQQVIYTFNMMENLLVMPRSWIDVEGTRYSNSDLYGKIIDDWESQPEVRKHWNIHVRSCYVRDFGDKPVNYDPLNLKLPFKKNEKGEKISWWPTRMTYDDLRRKEVTDAYVFATQQLNDPVGGDDAGKVFPIKYMRWISRKEFAKVPTAYHIITVDTADTVGLRSNNTVITVTSWDHAGRCYVNETQIGKMLPDEIITNLFLLNMKYRPIRIIIEETAFVRGLKPSIKRKTDVTGALLPLDFIKRENTTSKQERIQNTLQPWLKAGEIVFLDDLVEKDHVIREFDRFPTWDDDFLDTLTDSFQNRDWFGRERARPVTQQQVQHRQNVERDAAMKRYLKIAAPWEEEEFNIPPPIGEFRSKTG